MFNHQLLKNEMAKFKDHNNENVVWTQVVLEHDTKSFKHLWEQNVPNTATLLIVYKSNALIFKIMTSKNGEIDNYLKEKNKEIYREALLYFISKHKKSKTNDWHSVLNEMDENEQYLFVQRLLDLFDDNGQLTEFVMFQQWNGLSLFQTLIKNGNIKALEMILYDQRMISDSNAKCKSLAQLFAADPPSNFGDTLNALKNGKKDKKILQKFTVIFDIHNHQFVTQQKAFNYLTLRSLSYDDTEFKIVEDTALSRGSLYCFGDGSDGRLGLGDKYNKKNHCALPTICSVFVKTKIIKIASYNRHSLCIDANRYVYSWGYNKFGQLGLGDKENRDTPQILEVLRPYKATNVAVGEYHSLILLDGGSVWSCGSGGRGRLGHGNKENVVTPKKIESLKDSHIVQIGCGDSHSCVISKDGKLFSFGKNDFGQCGFGHNDFEDTLVPTNVALMDGLVPAFVACGGEHTLILCTNGQVLSCGDGREGRLGHGNYDSQYTPQIIETLETKNVIQIAVGRNHSLCLTKHGILYTFGYGGKGRLGHNNKENQMIPKEIAFFKKNNIKIKECKGGYFHCCAVSRNDEVYLWGMGNGGCLGQGMDDWENKMIPTKLCRFEDMRVHGLSSGNGYNAIIAQNIESKENKEDDREWTLKGNKEINIKNKMENGSPTQILSMELFVKSTHLFGDSEWISVGNKRSFCRFTTLFVDNLKIGNDGKMIKLVDFKKIEEMHHSEILNAKYLLVINCKHKEIQKEEVKKERGQLYEFKDLKDIQFEIPSNETEKKGFNVGIYVQTQTESNFSLLKEFSIKN